MSVALVGRFPTNCTLCFPKQSYREYPLQIDEPNTIGLLLTVIGLFLTVGGLALSAWQTLSARRQTRDLSMMATGLSTVAKTIVSVGDQLSSVGKQLSTRYLGDAPYYFADVKGVVDRAKNDLLVTNTVPAIGLLNHYDDWLSVKFALEMAVIRKVRVKCVFANFETRRAVLREQFREAIADWNGWQARPGNATKLQLLLKRFGQDSTVTTSDTLFETFEIAYEQTIRTTYCQAGVVECSLRPPLNMWVADSKEAVFVIRIFAPKYVAHAFWTRDPSLIAALLTTYQEIFELGRGQNTHSDGKSSRTF
jgi:hypothetical protein